MVPQGGGGGGMDIKCNSPIWMLQLSVIRLMPLILIIKFYAVLGVPTYF